MLIRKWVKAHTYQWCNLLVQMIILTICFTDKVIPFLKSYCIPQHTLTTDNGSIPLLTGGRRKRLAIACPHYPKIGTAVTISLVARISCLEDSDQHNSFCTLLKRFLAKLNFLQVKLSQSETNFQSPQNLGPQTKQYTYLQLLLCSVL